jgi:hypothetical protein
MGWGIIIIQTFMKDIKVGPDLSAALSKTAEEKKFYSSLNIEILNKN